MADYYLNQLDPKDAPRFESSHCVAAYLEPTAQGQKRYQISMSGTVILPGDYHGPENGWRHDNFLFTLEIPADSFLPAYKGLMLEGAAPFITINSIYNLDEAVNAGWAVDTFDLERPVDGLVRECISIKALIAVRDFDGYLARVGYTLTFVGVETEMHHSTGLE